MILSLIIFLTLVADFWLSWTLGGWQGVGIFLVIIPVSILLTTGGAIAIGLVGTVFGKHDDRTKMKRFLASFLKGWVTLVCFVWLLPWITYGGVSFMNKTAPATLARITLSNGEKTVVFQSMMHIASPGFYDDIKKDMEQLVGQDYVFFYEGVKPGSEASLEKLSNLVGTDVSPEMYDTLADIAGLSFQGDEIFLNILPSVNVDLSTDEIVAIAEKNNIIAPAGEQAIIIDSVKKYYPTMSPFQKNIAQVLSRGMMNVLLRTYTSKNFISNIQSELPVFSILLDERNKNIVQSIINSPSKKIYIHYGALHFSGVYAELKKLDPKWEEVARTYYTVIR